MPCGGRQGTKFIGIGDVIDQLSYATSSHAFASTRSIGRIEKGLTPTMLGRLVGSLEPVSFLGNFGSWGWPMDRSRTYTITFSFRDGYRSAKACRRGAGGGREVVASATCWDRRYPGGIYRRRRCSSLGDRTGNGASDRLRDDGLGPRSAWELESVGSTLLDCTLTWHSLAFLSHFSNRSRSFCH